jgi:hypothetical protein
MLRRFFFNLMLLGLVSTSFRVEAQDVPLLPSKYGDLDQSGTIVVTDVQCMILLNLWAIANEPNVPPPACLKSSPCLADINCDATFNVLDVSIILRLALKMPMSAENDTNGNAIHDACELVYDSNNKQVIDPVTQLPLLQIPEYYYKDECTPDPTLYRGVCGENGNWICSNKVGDFSGTAGGAGRLRIQYECVAAIHPMELTEVCDGIDNNCNGEVDEGFGLLTCGDGICAQSQPECDQGIFFTQAQCLPNSHLQVPEICNNQIDDDCDGIKDEGCQCPTDDPDFEKSGNPCFDGLGICRGQGKYTCYDNTITCNAQALEVAVPETCNNLDDDCNGTTDEGFNLGQECDSDDSDLCPHGILVCADDGNVICQESIHVSEKCHDSLDNDCDGAIDEDCLDNKPDILPIEEPPKDPKPPAQPPGQAPGSEAPINNFPQEQPGANSGSTSGSKPNSGNTSENKPSTFGGYKATGAALGCQLRMNQNINSPAWLLPLIFFIVPFVSFQLLYRNQKNECPSPVDPDVSQE